MEQKRKGARSLKDLSADILNQLNEGTMETVNLTEWLAVDARILLSNVLKSIGRESYQASILDDIDKLKKQTINTINEAIGMGLLRFIKQNNDIELAQIISTHVSDTVRCWATYTIGRDADTDIDTKLNRLQSFAADHHFGVREIAWMAVRPHLAQEIETSIEVLRPWIESDDENVRRFATESTRPRGVWSEHIEVLKQTPSMALPLLEPLKSDSSKYVRDSVGNWLNDASKSQPEFVIELCSRWEKESPTKETAYIIKKALRTINK